MRVLFVTNIPSPYRVDFFNMLGKYVDLTVIFEAREAENIKFDYREDLNHFKTIYLSDGSINEKSPNLKILSYIKKNQYDYIFLTNYAYMTELVAFFKCIFSRIPFIIELDGGELKEEGFGKYHLKRFLLSKAVAYFSPSKVTDEYLMHYGASLNQINRYHFTSLFEKDIYKAPLSKNEKNQLRKKLKLDTKFTILYVGRMIEAKGVEHLVNAIKQSDIDCQCLLIGDAPDKVYSEYLSDLIDNDSRFIQYSFLSQQALFEYYRISDVFVFPTKYDPWGLVVNESMATGLPVISSPNAVSALELIQSEINGYILKSYDSIEEMKELLERLSNNSELLYRLACSSLETIKRYTIERMVDDHLNFMGVDR